MKHSVIITEFSSFVITMLDFHHQLLGIRMRNLILAINMFVSVTMVCFAQTPDRAATVITNDGKEYSGKIISEDSLQIVIEDATTRITVFKTQITSIKYFTDVKELAKVNGDFTFVGISLLTPGGVNIVVGKDFGKFGARLAAGYIGTAAGIQGNFLFNLSRSKSFNSHLSVGVGSSVIGTSNRYSSSSTWTYIGGFYDLNYGGFFLETGLSIGSGSYSNPQLMLQLGYVYEFR